MKPALLSLVASAVSVVHCIAQTTVAPALPSLRQASSRVYDVQQSVDLNDIPKGARYVRLWISIPDDGPAQRVLDLSVISAPGACKVVRDKDRGARFLYMEINKPKAETLNTTIAFSVQRSSIGYDLDPAVGAPLQDSQKALFAEELREDAPHMEVNDHIRQIVREVCGDEKNPVVRATKLLNHVADAADHYSKNPNVPTCGVGDAGSCLAKGGGCCTDLHSLFIALARGAGIPARLQMGYRLQPKNAGIEADPGYRCWAEYFISGYGWIPTDIVEADSGDIAGRANWFSGLTERRIHLNQGRDFDLPFKKNPARVNLMTIGYAEIDGKPVRVLPEGEKQPQLTRKVRYTERADSPSANSLSQASR